MSKVNINKLYLALLTQDDLSGLVFAAPEYIPGVRQIDAKAKTSTDKLYAEGVVWEQGTSVEETIIDMDLADLSNARYAKYLGHNVATEGGAYTKESDAAPYLAVLFEAEKGNGKKAYRAYYKGMLMEPDESVKGKEGKKDYQTHKVQATFQTLINNGMGVYKVDEDDPNCPVDIATTFFASVIVPTADTTVPTVTSVPIDTAFGVAVGANVVFTFSIAIQPATITSSNVFLMKTDGTLIAAALSVDATNKIVTLNPNASLDAGTYIAVCNSAVKSVAGIPLAANTIVNFTV
ncbi:MAG: major tail protein [Desulfosporosinus sp.]